eukprot:COSAG01_NODE_3883_length_5588_cov_9.286209_1_plen_189_part_00
MGITSPKWGPLKEIVFSALLVVAWRSRGASVGPGCLLGARLRLGLGFVRLCTTTITQPRWPGPENQPAGRLNATPPPWLLPQPASRQSPSSRACRCRCWCGLLLRCWQQQQRWHRLAAHLLASVATGCRSCVLACSGQGHHHNPRITRKDQWNVLTQWCQHSVRMQYITRKDQWNVLTQWCQHSVRMR